MSLEKCTRFLRFHHGVYIYLTLTLLAALPMPIQHSTLSIHSHSNTLRSASAFVSPVAMKSPPQHNSETRTSNHSQKFKGVRKRKWGKWVSEVRMPNSRERIWLGTFDMPQQAARAHDAAVYCLRGGKAKFNFPDTPPEIPSARSLSREQIKAAATSFALEWPSAEVAHPPSPSPSDFTPIDTQHISLEDEDFEFWESLFADSADILCWNSDMEIFPTLTACASPAEIPAAEQRDSWAGAVRPTPTC